MACFQVGAALVQVAVMLRRASHISFIAASSVGKWPRVLRVFQVAQVATDARLAALTK